MITQSTKYNDLSQKEINHANRVLAFYMGYVQYDGGDKNIPNDPKEWVCFPEQDISRMHIKQLQYDYNWNVLIPVWNKFVQEIQKYKNKSGELLDPYSATIELFHMAIDENYITDAWLTLVNAVEYLKNKSEK